MTDEQIAKFFDDELRPARLLKQALDRLDLAMNPDTILGNKPLREVTPIPVNLPEIDLRHPTKLDIRYEFHGTFRGKQQWTCWDDNSYDGDESDIGSGESKEDALADLMDKIGEKAAEPKPRVRTEPVGLGNPNQPPELRVVPYSDPDEE